MMYPICFKVIINKTQIYAIKNFSNNVFSKNCVFQNKKPQRQWHFLKHQAADFHTTQKRDSPILMAMSIASVLSGSYVRQWWLRQPSYRQHKYLKWYKNRRHMIHGSLAVVSFITIIYCLKFVKRDSIVKSPRFILFNEAEQAKHSNMFFKLIVRSKDNVVPLSDPRYSRIAKVMKNLAKSNRDIFRNTNWNITIAKRMFDLISVPTIMVLSDGNIIVFSDIFKFIKNDDQLTFSLAHEMAHQMLLHPLEALSYEFVRTIIVDIIWFVIFALYPPWIAAACSLITYFFSMSIYCWYKRRCEIEADKIGFELSAKSCIDLREVFVFWELMKRYRDLVNQDLLYIPFFNVHPPIEERIKRLNNHLPKALKLRTRAECPELPDTDPRNELPRHLKELDDELRKDLDSFKLNL